MFHSSQPQGLFDRRYPSHCTIYLPTLEGSHMHALTLLFALCFVSVWIEGSYCSPPLRFIISVVSSSPGSAFFAYFRRGTLAETKQAE